MLHGYKGYFPQIKEGCFIAEGAQLIGKVWLEEGCSVWYNAVLRGDVHEIKIGKRTNIQDGCVLHVGEDKGLCIGEGVTIGHNVTLHGCTIGDYSLIGMGSIVLDGVRIGKNCLIGAGSLVTGGMVIPDGMLVLGAPAKVIKPLTEAQKEDLVESAKHYERLIADY
ncbi:gamma carbonic anhydrase family protein [Sporanaerobium hydrogeniformans]|uniref:Gamma carbonic anhydrase family protein n=1 Tax=Sporanaerobium hydrogeniformans TaxID=3072179 RepID=A0AC61DCA3_9FIRM|nr:gamma carbonic anhydrase family protein [Sporanaerobium hydrogeniformans]PHV70914.1 gamma carbonic anhydrase family protein [Sporanaerobium hydrogeniformans]